MTEAPAEAPSIAVGFTGSRNGPQSPGQTYAFVETIRGLRIAKFTYGDCVGWDEEALLKVHGHHPDADFHSRPASLHPGWDKQWRARTKERYPHIRITEHPAARPWPRNRMIVAESDLLIACTEQDYETRSGTWGTIGIAREVLMPVIIIGPSGNIRRVGG